MLSNHLLRGQKTFRVQVSSSKPPLITVNESKLDRIRMDSSPVIQLSGNEHDFRTLESVNSFGHCPGNNRRIEEFKRDVMVSVPDISRQHPSPGYNSRARIERQQVVG
ncbi:hypothetical protein EV1_001960 [Malus domestica]